MQFNVPSLGDSYRIFPGGREDFFLRGTVNRMCAITGVHEPAKGGQFQRAHGLLAISTLTLGGLRSCPQDFLEILGTCVQNGFSYNKPIHVCLGEKIASHYKGMIDVTLLVYNAHCGQSL